MINISDPEVRQDLREKLAADTAYMKDVQGTPWLDFRPAGIALSWMALFEELLRISEYMHNQCQGMMHSFGTQVAGAVALQAEHDELRNKLRSLEEENALLKARGKGLN